MEAVDAIEGSRGRPGTPVNNAVIERVEVHEGSAPVVGGLPLPPPGARGSARGAARGGHHEDVLEVRHIASDEEASRGSRIANHRMTARTRSRSVPVSRTGSPAACTAERRPTSPCLTPTGVGNPQTSEGERMSLAIGDRRPDRAATPRARSTRSTRTAGERWCLRPTTAVRAGVARADPGGGGRLLGARRALPRREPQRRRAYPATPGRDARAGGRRRRLADPLPARRDPGRGARVRRQDHARRVRARRRGAGSLPRRAGFGPLDPSATPPGCARRSMRCSRGRTRPAGDRSGRLQRQVEAVTTATTASVSARSGSTASAPHSRRSATPWARSPPRPRAPPPRERP